MNKCKTCVWDKSDNIAAPCRACFGKNKYVKKPNTKVEDLFEKYACDECKYYPCRSGFLPKIELGTCGDKAIK